MLSSIERGRKRFWSSENAVALVQKASPHSGVDMRFHAVGADPIVGRYCARKELDAVPEGGVLHADRRENEQCFGGVLQCAYRECGWLLPHRCLCLDGVELG